MGLISPAQQAKIKQAIESVTDTFMQKPLIYRKYGESLDRFNENRRNNQKLTEYNILGLVVWGSLEGDKTAMDSLGRGGVDMSDGYIAFHVKDLLAVGLVDVLRNFVGKSNSDYIIDQGIEHRIIGHSLKGQFISENLIVKIYIQKKKKDG